MDTGSEESSKDNKVSVEQHGLGQKRPNMLLYKGNSILRSRVRGARVHQQAVIASAEVVWEM